MSHVRHRCVRLGVTAAALGLVVGAGQRKARADIAPVVFYNVVNDTVKAIQTYYTVSNWVFCHYDNDCPPTDVQVAADNAIVSIEGAIAQYDTSISLADLQSLLDEAHRDFSDPSALTQQEEMYLVNKAESTFDQYYTKLNNFDPTNTAQVAEAYILAPAFNILAALLDLLARTELASNHVPMTIDQLNEYRRRTLVTDEALVGSQSLWYPCAGSSAAPTMVSTVQSFNDYFPTKKLWKMFADYHFSETACSDYFDCDPFRRVTGSAVCQVDCSQSEWGICWACYPGNDSGPYTDDQHAYTQEEPKILARMDRDPVVVTVRAAMEMLVGLAASHGSGLLWRGPAGDLDLWNVRSDTSYSMSVVGFADLWAWQPVGTGDFNGDGLGDVLWIDRQDGLLSLWQMNSSGGVATMTPATANAPNLSGLVAHVGDLDADGIADIVWTGATTIQLPWPSPPLTNYITITWMMNAGSTTPRSVSTTVSTSQQLVALGDFARYTSAATAPYQVQKLWRSTTGDISIDGAPPLATVSSDWVVIGTGDFNGDRSDDVLWYNTTGGWVSIWMISANQWMGSYNPGGSDPSGGWTIQGIADLDHDGISDIVWRHTSGAVSYWMMNGQGTVRSYTYTAPSAANTTSNTFVGAIALGPPTPSNVPADTINQNYCSLVGGTPRNAGFGTTETWTQWGFYGSFETLAGDVDGDGMDDLVAVSPDNNSLWFARSNGSGFPVFTQAYSGALTNASNALLGDITGDGRADLVVLGYGYVAVLPGDVDSPLMSMQVWAYATLDGAYGSLLGDIDGDGDADLVTLNQNSVSVYRSTGSGLGDFSHPETGVGSQVLGTHGTFLADVDGDGRADLITVNGTGVVVRRATGAGPGGVLFNDPETWLGFGFWGTHGTLMRDVNGDGRADLVALLDGQVIVRRSIGTGFGSPEIWWDNGTFAGAHGTLIGDFDGNGKADLVSLGNANTVIRSQ